MKIYTKTGDDGTTGLSGGDRVSKDSLRMNAIGTVDELNSCLGLMLCACPEPSISQPTLLEIQAHLFEIGAELSCPPGGRLQFQTLDEADVSSLESGIDEMESLLEPLKNFILPGGIELAARAHFARSVCRRAERHLRALHDAEPFRMIVLAYVNRLSDWLFVFARTANRIENVEESKWVGRKKE